jgi:hypothetical protein
MPLCLKCGQSTPGNPTLCGRCGGTEFSKFDSKILGSNEVKSDLDMTGFEELLKTGMPTYAPSEESMKEVLKEAKQRQRKGKFKRLFKGK